MTNKEAVFTILRSRRWIHGEEIEDVGGLRRLRELREDGYEIKSRPSPEGGYHDYRLVSTRRTA